MDRVKGVQIPLLLHAAGTRNYFLFLLHSAVILSQLAACNGCNGPDTQSIPLTYLCNGRVRNALNNR